MLFPSEQHRKSLRSLANALEAIVSPATLPVSREGTRPGDREILKRNTGVRATIRERRWEQSSAPEIGAKHGMRTFDESLEELYLGRSN